MVFDLIKRKSFIAGFYELYHMAEMLSDTCLFTYLGPSSCQMTSNVSNEKAILLARVNGTISQMTIIT